MSLRSEWENETETPNLLELALIDRFLSAVKLVAEREWDAAIYLFGYVAEMALKTAYFRVVGNNAADPVGPMLRPARNAGRLLLPGVSDENYHGLLFWSELLRAKRHEQSRPMGPDMEATLGGYTRVLSLNWMVEMRYHPNRADRADALEVAEAATWIFNNRVDLGR